MGRLNIVFDDVARFRLLDIGPELWAIIIYQVPGTTFPFKCLVVFRTAQAATQQCTTGIAMCTPPPPDRDINSLTAQRPTFKIFITFQETKYILNVGRRQNISINIIYEGRGVN